MEGNAKRTDHLQRWPGAERLRAWKAATTDLNFGREIVADWAALIPDLPEINVLDVGMGRGGDLASVREALAPREARLHGIDIDSERVEEARERGTDAHVLDIESESLPYRNETFAFTIANQVLEHVKELFWVVGEVHRTLQPGGLFCVGVPNLASLHNRVLLGAGEQPSSIEVLGPHVRGYTPRGLRRMLEWGDYFEVVGTAGSNFYPLPLRAARAAARAWPGAAVSTFALARKTAKPGAYTDGIRDDMVIGSSFRLDPAAEPVTR
jgi:SAM-dependent methyltransferase